MHSHSVIACLVLTEVDYEFVYLINNMQSHCMQTLLVLPLNNLVPKSKKLATSNVCSQCGVSVLGVAGGHGSPHFSWPQWYKVSSCPRKT